MDSDITSIISLKDGDSTVFDHYKYDLTVPMLQSTTFSKANPITRAFLLALAKFGPLDLIKNQRIDTGKALSQYNRKEFHHVFPQAVLKRRSSPAEKIYCVLNFCFLSSDSNKKISQKSPSEYFFSMLSKDDYTSILNSNLLPVGKDIYQNDNFDKFLEKRAHLFLSKLDELTT